MKEMWRLQLEREKVRLQNAQDRRDNEQEYREQLEENRLLLEANLRQNHLQQEQNKVLFRDAQKVLESKRELTDRANTLLSRFEQIADDLELLVKKQRDESCEET